MMIRAGIAITLLTAACGGGSTPPPDAVIDPRQTVVEVPVTENRDLDLLFVIDDSGSMTDKQQNLRNNFPSFIDRLAMGQGGLPNLHLGVVTTDMGTKGSASPSPAPPVGQVGQGGCANDGKGGDLTVNGAAVTGTFLSDIRLPDATRSKNYTGDLATTFGQMASVGATGCGFEQPLAAMRAALDNNPANAGFLRPDALLAVVFLADEDDCSVKDPAFFGPESGSLGPLQSFRCTRFGVTCANGGATPDAMNQLGPKDQCTASTSSTLLDDVAPYRDFLVGLKGDPRKVIVGGILGATEPVVTELRAINGTQAVSLAHSCTYQGPSGIEVGDPAIRLQSFLDLFPDRATISTICQPDLSGALDAIGQLVATTIGSPCVNAPLTDAAPGTPGLQPDCIVEDLVGARVTAIEPCEVAEPTCWELVPDAAACPSFDNLKLVVVRSDTPDPATVTRMRCVVR